MKRFLTGLSLSGVVGMALACNQTDPSAGPGTEGDYHPLVDGATWTYRHTRVGASEWTEFVEMRAQEYEGMSAFVMRDSEDGQGQISESFLIRDGTLVERIHKDVSVAGATIARVDYDPGFLRFDEGWKAGDEVDWTYERTEYDADGTKVGVAERLQQFTVESTAASVTVSAGAFDGCATVLRHRPDNNDLDRYWFAPGVGKIKHEDLLSGAVEELTEYDVP